MKEKIKIQFHYSPWFHPKLHRRPVSPTSSSTSGNHTGPPSPKPRPMVLVIRPDGKVVRTPKPTSCSSAVGATV